MSSSIPDPSRSRLSFRQVSVVAPCGDRAPTALRPPQDQQYSGPLTKSTDYRQEDSKGAHAKFEVKITAFVTNDSGWLRVAWEVGVLGVVGFANFLCALHERTSVIVASSLRCHCHTTPRYGTERGPESDYPDTLYTSIASRSECCLETTNIR